MPVIDFRNTNEVWYRGNQISEVWYRGEKIWSKPVFDVLFEGSVYVSEWENALELLPNASMWKDGRVQDLSGKTIVLKNAQGTKTFTITSYEATLSYIKIQTNPLPTTIIDGNYEVSIRGNRVS
ncbi:TPA: hypothetical protein ACGO1T_000562 [Streptococcus suis]